jgi:DNA (cytosine-5)-methyltransferase 1
MTAAPVVNRRLPATVSETMSRIRSESTGPEVAFQKALRKAGIRSFRICDTNLPGKPDLVLPGKKLVIFIDGDLWHGHQYALRGHVSVQAQFSEVHNARYWSIKLSKNVERDFKNTALLLESGWRVLRFWESDIRKNVSRCVKTTIKVARDCQKPEAAYNELARRTAVEMFAGIGLVREALQTENWQVVFANDNDPDKLDIYSQNFSQSHFDERSIADISAIEIPSAALVTASFPCNDLSLAGARKGLNGRHSSTFWELIRLLKGLGKRKPPLVLLENVFGFLTSHDGRDFETALLALKELGYSCDAFVIDAAHFVPQSRVRLFVVASLQQPRPESTDHLVVTSLRPKQLITFVREHKNISWNIRPLSELPKLDIKLRDVLQDLADDDPQWWNAERAEYFLQQLSKRHRIIADAMIAGDEYTYGTAFRRIRHGRSMAELRVDGIAGCLRTPRGGSGRQILFKAGCGRYWVRLLTGRECARLQGAEDTFRIDCPLNQALFGFGDAVCVPAIRWIAVNYLTPIAVELMRGSVLTPYENERQKQLKAD